MPTQGQPRPWWQVGDQNHNPQTPQQASANLTSSAPAGYEYNPVDTAYERTPTGAGQRVAQFTDAALGGVPSLAGLTGASASGAFGTGTSAGGGTGAGGAGGYVAPIQPPDPTSANNAIFAQAKDKVGQLSRASLDSLNGEMGSQGMLGSGAQVQGTRDIVANSAGNLGQVDRDLASKNADTAADFAKTGYEGAITQRGQDVQAQEANARLALEQRAQQYSLLNMIMNSMKTGGGSTSTTPLY